MSKDSFGIDLHMHSTASDGLNTPKELVKMAQRQGLRVIALTDHDTTGGLSEILKAAENTDITVVRGVEMSVRCSIGGTLHILGYNIDNTDQQFTEFLTKCRRSRAIRNVAIIAKLNELGKKIDLDDIKSRLNADTAMGRPHIADALLRNSYVHSFREAFDLYLGDKGRAFVPRQLPNAEETIFHIHRSGGKAFVAHPCTLGAQGEELRQYLTEMRLVGLDGIEVYNPACNATQISEYLTLAKNLNLLISAGSDFHGYRRRLIPMGHYKRNQKIKSDMVDAWFYEQGK